MIGEGTRERVRAEENETGRVDEGGADLWATALRRFRCVTSANFVSSCLGGGEARFPVSNRIADRDSPHYYRRDAMLLMLSCEIFCNEALGLRCERARLDRYRREHKIV